MIALREYPHIAQGVEECWGTADLQRFVDSLTLQCNYRHQTGFSPKAFSELLFIAETHKMIYGF